MQHTAKQTTNATSSALHLPDWPYYVRVTLNWRTQRMARQKDRILRRAPTYRSHTCRTLINKTLRRTAHVNVMDMPATRQRLALTINRRSASGLSLGVWKNRWKTRGSRETIRSQASSRAKRRRLYWHWRPKTGAACCLHGASFSSCLLPPPLLLRRRALITNMTGKKKKINMATYHGRALFGRR